MAIDVMRDVNVFKDDGSHVTFTMNQYGGWFSV